MCIRVSLFPSAPKTADAIKMLFQCVQLSQMVGINPVEFAGENINKLKQAGHHKAAGMLSQLVSDWIQASQAQQGRR
jgi:hypothetical protein